jgi:hypothetical protein
MLQSAETRGGPFCHSRSRDLSTSEPQKIWLSELNIDYRAAFRHVVYTWPLFEATVWATAQ